MIQTRAFQILSTLNKDEFADFSRFIISPFFNRSKDLNKFFSAVKKYYPLFDSPNLEYEKIYKKLYPGKKFSEGTIRNLFSDLGSVAEKFLAYVEYENTYEYDHNILSQTNKRYLDKEFERNYKKSSEKNKTKQYRYGKKNLNQFFIDAEMWVYTQRLNIDFSKSSRNNVFEALFTFFLHEFLVAQSSQVNVTHWYKDRDEHNILEIFFEFTNMEAIVERLKKNNSPFYEDIKLPYYLGIAAQNKAGKFAENFEKAYKLFNEKINEIPKDEQIRLYIGIINVINMYIKAGDKNLREAKFTLEKEMIEKGICLDAQGKMTADMFVHIMHDALTAGEINWAQEFLENKIDIIDDDARAKADINYYYKARLLTRGKKFGESNEELLKISIDDVTFKIDAKVLKMVNFYELEYIESCFSQAEALRQFIIRNNESYIGRKELWTNFLKFYSVLLRKKSGMDCDIPFAKKELAECDVLKNKDWLIEKFNEL